MSLSGQKQVVLLILHFSISKNFQLCRLSSLGLYLSVEENEMIANDLIDFQKITFNLYKNKRKFESLRLNYILNNNNFENNNK